jgi:hypothetical protein
MKDKILKLAEEAGLPQDKIEDIYVKGSTLTDLIIKEYKASRTRYYFKDILKSPGKNVPEKIKYVLKEMIK